MPKKTTEATLSIIVNQNYIPFDFASLLTNDEVVQVFKEHNIDISEQDTKDIKIFLQQWLEVLYLQYKRKSNLDYGTKEGDIILQGEFRRAS
jgi:hypothetical protein